MRTFTESIMDNDEELDDRTDIEVWTHLVRLIVKADIPAKNYKVHSKQIIDFLTDHKIIKNIKTNYISIIPRGSHMIYLDVCDKSDRVSYFRCNIDISTYYNVQVWLLPKERCPKYVDWDGIYNSLIKCGYCYRNHFSQYAYDVFTSTVTNIK